MSDKSISNTYSDNGSSEATGRLLMIVVAIIWAIPLIIGLWAAFTGGRVGF